MSLTKKQQNTLKLFIFEELSWVRLSRNTMPSVDAGDEYNPPFSLDDIDEELPTHLNAEQTFDDVWGPVPPLTAPLKPIADPYVSDWGPLSSRR